MSQEIIPLSALPEVRVTEETLDELMRAGLPCPAGCTELAAQHLLLLRSSEVPIDCPACFGVAFTATDPVCGACLWQPRCVVGRKVPPPVRTKAPPPLPGKKS